MDNKTFMLINERFMIKFFTLLAQTIYDIFMLLINFYPIHISHI